jgi:hypothetical protein
MKEDRVSTATSKQRRPFNDYNNDDADDNADSDDDSSSEEEVSSEEEYAQPSRSNDGDTIDSKNDDNNKQQRWEGRRR